MIVGWSGLCLVDGVFGGVHIESKIDSRRRQGVHAVIVAHGVIDGVDTESIDAQFLESIELTLVSQGSHRTKTLRPTRQCLLCIYRCRPGGQRGLKSLRVGSQSHGCRTDHCQQKMRCP